MRGGRRPVLADRVETVVRQTPSSVVDRMEPTVRDHTAEMVDREATVVRVERVGLLEVEDEVGQVNEEAKDSVDSLDRKSHVLSPFVLAHTGGCVVRFLHSRYRAFERTLWQRAEL